VGFFRSQGSVLSGAAAGRPLNSYDLNKARLDVWFDGWELELGDDLTRKLQDGIQTHQYLVVILSPEAVESEWVNVEWTAAFVRGIDEKRIAGLPILYRTRDVPPFLNRLIYIDFRDESQYDTQLLSLTARLLGKTKRPEIGNCPW